MMHGQQNVKSNIKSPRERYVFTSMRILHNLNWNRSSKTPHLTQKY